MADHTHIEWTDATWNPAVGCTSVSNGCLNCYAARDASGRLAKHPVYTGLAAGGRFTGQVRLLPQRLQQPLRWRKPRRIFVTSMGDLFHDAIPDDYIARVYAVMALTARHTFQVLTKRHGRAHALLNSEAFRDTVAEHATAVMSSRSWARWQLDLGGQRLAGDSGHGPQWTVTHTTAGNLWAPSWPLPNVWFGVSIEDQRWADIRTPVLLQTPAAVRWLSCEPLLAPIDLHPWLKRPQKSCNRCHVAGPLDYDSAHLWGTCACSCHPAPPPRPDWVVAGGESGRNARAMHPDWARRLRDQCSAAGVPFLFKQWGEWLPIRGHREHLELPPADREWIRLDDETMVRVGKRAAGRQLDGRVWDEYPDGAR